MAAGAAEEAAPREGKKAAGANLEKLKEAQLMDASDQEIWEKTGWWLNHPDGKPRWEIDDSMTDYRPRDSMDDRAAADPVALAELDKLRNQRGTVAAKRMQEIRNEQGLLGDYYSAEAFLEHPDLYENYPRIGRMGWSEQNWGPGRHGEQHPNEIKINQNMSDTQKRSTALHEVNHAVQDTEGFAKGSSPDYMRTQINQAQADASMSVMGFHQARAMNKACARLMVLASERKKYASDSWTVSDTAAALEIGDSELSVMATTVASRSTARSVQ